MTYSDEQLIVNYLKGDEKSLEILIKRYFKPIYGFVYRYVGDTQAAGDITQETFVKAWRNLKKFNRNKRFKTWIFSIAKNSAIDFLRKKKPIPFSEFENEEGVNVLVERLGDLSPSPLEILEQKDLSHTLTNRIEKIPAKYRSVISLRYKNHLNFREIAELLRQPLNTVKSWHRRAIIMLRK